MCTRTYIYLIYTNMYIYIQVHVVYTHTCILINQIPLIIKKNKTGCKDKV